MGSRKNKPLQFKGFSSRFLFLQSHCSVEKAALLSVLNLRLLPTNDKYELTGEVLRAALKEDLANGKIPFHVGVLLQFIVHTLSIFGRNKNK